MKSFWKEPTNKRCLLISALKSFRLQVKGKHSIGREFQSLAVRRKKLLAQASLTHLGIMTVKSKYTIFLGGSFSNRDNVRAQSNLQEKGNLGILRDDFSSRTSPSIFTSITSNKTSWLFPALKPTSHFLLKSTVSCRSGSSSSCCHRSDA